ncbi:MAG: hypothetical protein Q8P41_14125 [Pseudomonadota bacterium]|nr:hypothetical protein [Pseudomonadota bacterium]
MIPWEFERDGERLVLEPEGPSIATHGPLLLRAAPDGAGFASTFEGYVEQHVAEGRLIRVLDDWLPWFSRAAALLPEAPPGPGAAPGVHRIRAGESLCSCMSARQGPTMPAQH